MNYTRLVLKFASTLSSYFKPAADLASLLDYPLFRLTDDEGKLLQEQDHGDVREKVFTIFCTALAKAGVPVPPLEEELWRKNLPRVWDEKKHAEQRTLASDLRSELLNTLDEHTSEAAHEVRTLANAFVILADLGAFDSIERRQVIAVLNQKLVDEMKLDPIRPNYARLSLPTVLSAIEPRREIKLLIVDDSEKDMLNSALALAGIWNLSVEFFRHVGDSWPELEGEEKQKELARVADAVMAANPDIVLMDQGLRGIKGSDVVPVIKARGSRTVFVANTGGEARELELAGCLSNFHKGTKSGGMFEALSRFK